MSEHNYDYEYNEKFFLSYRGIEKEVTKKEFVKAERDAGFYNTDGKIYEPATGAFTSREGISGRTEIIFDKEREGENE